MVRVGQRLLQERSKRQLSLDDIAEATKIKPRFLAAIERGEYEKLPSPAYAKGFVRNYAAYLGLPRTEVTALFRREFDERRAYQVLPNSLTKTKEFPLGALKMQQSLFIIGAIALIFLSYLAFQYRSLIIAPSLSVATPTQVSSTDVTITGKTDSNATISINNQPVSVASNGEFRKSLNLFPGKSILTIKAKNRMGKETIKQQAIDVKL